jgi:hypothetical protein
MCVVLMSCTIRYLIPALVSLKARFVYRNLCLCPPFIPQRKQSNAISYWSPCMVYVIFVCFFLTKALFEEISWPKSQI